MEEGDGGRSFEDVVDIYRFQIRKVDVVLLSYKITLLESFYDLEYWVSQANALCNDETVFIFVGTHMDRESEREVLPELVDVGKNYLTGMLKKLRPDWRGECSTLEVSNLTGANIQHLRNVISFAILRSHGVISALPSLTWGNTPPVVLS